MVSNPKDDAELSYWLVSNDSVQIVQLKNILKYQGKGVTLQDTDRLILHIVIQVFIAYIM